MYRLKFLGEQRAFDTVSVAYILPLIFLVLQNGGYAEKNSDAADEQLILALEFLAFHTEAGKRSHHSCQIYTNPNLFSMR